MIALLVIIPVLSGVVLYLLSSKKANNIIVIVVQLALVSGAFCLFLVCKEGDVVVRIGNYEGLLGIILIADNLSSVFVMLASFVFLIVSLYSLNEDHGRLYWFLLFIWEGLLIGIFLSGDLFNIFVLAEVATLVVSILIMLNRGNSSMYDGMVYLMVNTVAVQFYLFGTGYIYKLTGVLDLNTAAQAVKELDKAQLILPYALVITSVSLKCALMPLFNWLPRAHGSPGAPAPVSAILSGLHIKSGIYLFIRFQSLFTDITVPDFFLATGIITGIAGFILAISQTDIKLILAYHTISQIGMIMIGLNSGGISSWTGAVYHIISHTLFKSALFLCAGIIIHTYGTRDIYKIRGVLRRMPLIGAATIMAVFGITGAPFFNGSISKYFIMSGANFAVNAAVIFINLGTIISFIKYSTMLFGPSVPEKAKVDLCQQAAVLILSALCLAGGIFGEQFIWFLFGINVSIDTIGYIEKAVYFILSVAAGLLIYRYLIRINTFFKRIREFEIGFRGACVSIGVFFALILFVTRFLAV